MPDKVHHDAPMKGVRIVSLALNLPGPAALLRCARMGADCLKLEPPGGDPMAHYSVQAYADLHAGVRTAQIDLKSEAGQRQLSEWLAETDILLTSFRPAALHKLGLGWSELHQRFPSLCQVAIVGAPGPRADEPGHDLTYLAEHGLVSGTEVPATLFADMAGALLASEAVLQVLRLRDTSPDPQHGGVHLEVALSSAAEWLAQPRVWNLTKTGDILGGAHAGYQVYACADGRVAIAALEPHFAERLCNVAGIDAHDMQAQSVQRTLAAWAGKLRCAELDGLAARFDLPLVTLRDAA